MLWRKKKNQEKNVATLTHFFLYIKTYFRYIISVIFIGNMFCFELHSKNYVYIIKVLCNIETTNLRASYFTLFCIELHNLYVQSMCKSETTVTKACVWARSKWEMMIYFILFWQKQQQHTRSYSSYLCLLSLGVCFWENGKRKEC